MTEAKILGERARFAEGLGETPRTVQKVPRNFKLRIVGVQ